MTTTRSEDFRLPFREHLVELRRRLIRCCVTVGIVFAIAFNYAAHILDFLAEPLAPFIGGGTFVYPRLQDGFFMFFKISLVVALVAAAPFIIYETFMFMAPGLYEKERRVLRAVIAVASLSFFTAFAFVYRLALPVFFNFFSRFVFDFYRFYPNVIEYVDFVLSFTLYAGMMFMLPLAIFLAAHFGVVSVARLRQLRPGFIILSFIVAAAITPPDIVSQILVSVVMIALFEIGLFAARLSSWGLFSRRLSSGGDK